MICERLYSMVITALINFPEDFICNVNSKSVFFTIYFKLLMKVKRNFRTVTSEIQHISYDIRSHPSAFKLEERKSSYKLQQSISNFSTCKLRISTK